MADEASLIRAEKQYERAEAQTVTRDLAIEGRMRFIASEGLAAAQRFQHEQSRAFLNQLKALVPAIVQDLRLEMQEQAASDRLATMENSEHARATQLDVQERRLDEQEIRILNSMKGYLNQVKALVQQGRISEAKTSLSIVESQLQTLIRENAMEISIEGREQQLIGRDPVMANFIGQEKGLLNILSRVIHDIDRNLDSNRGIAAIIQDINQAEIMIGRFIDIETAQARRATGRMN